MTASRRGWTYRLAAIGVALTLVAAACGDDDDDAGDASTSGPAISEQPGETSASTPDETATSEPGPDTSEAPGEPRQGGELVFAATNETASLDPLDHGRASTTSFPLHMFYDSLTEFTREGDVVPFLAESVTPNDDNTVWTVTLREGVEFHDGTPFDADAVVYNINRFQQDEVGSNVYGVNEIVTVEAVDDLTVEFTVKEPWGAFPTMLALSPGFMVSPTAVEDMGRDRFAQEGAVGTGPFVLVERTPDSRTVGERNPNYWQEGQPYLDRFVYAPIVDAQTRFASIQSGDVDIVQTNIGRQIAQAKEDGELGVNEFQGNGGNSVVFNQSGPPMDDVRIRRAMAHAINRDVINEVLYAGTMVETCGPYNSDSVWYVETTCYEYDPETARQLVEEYEAETGQEAAITFLCSTNAGLPEQTELLQQFWTEVGIDVTVDQVDPLVQLERTRAEPAQFQVMCWFGDFNTDPDERFRTFYDSRYAGATRDNYSNPEVDAAFDAGRAAETFEDRKEAYGTVQTLLAEDLPHIYWTTRLDAAIFDPKVQGLEIVPGGGFWPGRIWIDEQ